MDNMNVLTDIMNYYYFNYGMMYSLFAIILIATWMVYKHRPLRLLAIIITSTAGIGMMTQAFFLGILADNAAPNIEQWLLQAQVMIAITLTLWFLQVINLLRKTKQKNVD